MINIDDHKLDNPVWYSLNETHKEYAIDYEGFKFYNPAYCPFGGFIDGTHSTKNIDAYAALIKKFFVVGERPLFSSKISLHNNLVCNQMVLKRPIKLEAGESIVELVAKKHKADLSVLVNLVQPGYFKDKTSELGHYFGIYKAGQLIAVTGQRMSMNSFTEVSAVVTHPEHLRKGYAKQLVQHATNQIFSEGRTPYLHVASSNIGAIKLYEKLGFITRRKISFWNFKTSK